MRFEAPETLDAAVTLLRGETGLARPLAGGTDQLVQLRAGFVEPDLVVDLKRIPEMRHIIPTALIIDLKSPNLSFRWT